MNNKMTTSGLKVFKEYCNAGGFSTLPHQLCSLFHCFIKVVS